MDQDDELIVLSPELIDLLTNYDQFFCLGCGRGVSVPKGQVPERCRACPGTVFDNVDETVY